MNKLELLVSLLEKKQADENDRAQLDSLLRENDLKDFYEAYVRIRRALNKEMHLSVDELKDYIFIKNNKEPENRQIFALTSKIESHLRDCSLCRGEFTLLNREFSDIDIYVASQFESSGAGRSAPVRREGFFRSRSLVLAVVLMGFLYLALFGISELTTPGTYRYAKAYDEEYYVTRGRPTDDFQRSAAALEEGNFETAIGYLEQDIRNNQQEGTIFYSHYILGITYLKASYRDFAGLFPSYNPEMVRSGISNLEAAVAKNSTGSFKNISAEAYYHLGRGYLMIDQPDSAKYYLSLVVSEKGSKMKEAEEIIRGIEE